MMPHFKEFVEFCRMKEGAARNTRHQIANLERFLASIGNPSHVTTHHLGQWIDWQRANKSNPNMIRLRRGTVARYYRYLARIGVIERSPVDLELMPRVTPKKAERFPFSEDQYKKILEATAKHKDPWWHNACVVAWATGLRLSDVCQLSKKAVNTEERTLRLVPHKTREIKPDPIDIPIDNDAWVAVIQQYNDRTWGDSPFLFPYMQSRFILEGNTNKIGMSFGNICKAAGLPDHSFHSFRHSFITRMLEGQMDSLMICSITGLDPAQIATYAHISVDAKRKAMHSAKLVLAQRGSFGPDTTLSIVESA